MVKPAGGGEEKEWEMKREKGEGGKFRLKEIVFYNLFLYLFDIIEILIKVTRF